MYVGPNPNDPFTHVFVCCREEHEMPAAGFADEYAEIVLPAAAIDHRGVTHEGCGVEQLA